MKDMHSHLLIVSAIGAVVASADVASAAIDLQGYNGAELVLAIGAGGIAFSDANRSRPEPANCDQHCADLARWRPAQLHSYATR